MKTVRFSQIVQKAGKPEMHLLWTAADKDPEFTKALKAARVMTVHQAHGVAKADYGSIGYEKDVQGQFLIFPKSLKTFEGKRVVGVKYDLFTEKKIPKSQQAKPAKPPQPKKPPSAKPPKHHIKTDEDRPTEPEHEEAKGKPKATQPHTTEIPEPAKKQIQKAMRFLKSGKQVQAYEALESLLELPGR